MAESPLSASALREVPEVRRAWKELAHCIGPIASPEDDPQAAMLALIVAIRDATLAAHTQTLAGMTPDVEWNDLARGAAANFARWIDCPDCGDTGECESCQKAWRKIVLPLVPAIRRITLSAERARQVGMTPEAVIEAAITEAVNAKTGDCDNIREVLALELRAALPVLLAPEVARREQAEADFRDELEEHARTLHDWEKATRRLSAAEAEATRMREALERIAQDKERHNAPYIAAAALLADADTRRKE